jgi:hypothetical protein
MDAAEGGGGLTGKPIFLFLLLLVRLVPVCPAQRLSWRNVDTAYGPLPASFHVYRSDSLLHGFPFIAYYVSARLKDKKLLFTAETGQGKRFTPLQYYQLEQFPLLVVNCSFFSYLTDQNLSLVMKEGKIVDRGVTTLQGTGRDSVLYYYPTRGAFGIDRQHNADVAWIFTDSSHRKPYAFEDGPVVAKGEDAIPSIYDLRDIEWKWWKMRTAVGGGPVLIHNGKIRITNREEQLYPGEEGAYHPRTAIGYTRDGRLIVLAIQGRTPGIAAGATLEEEARILLDLGCYEALNLDGGGSSCLLVNGKETIKPSDKDGEQPLPAVFLIKRKG